MSPYAAPTNAYPRDVPSVRIQGDPIAPNGGMREGFEKDKWSNGWFGRPPLSCSRPTPVTLPSKNTTRISLVDTLASSGITPRHSSSVTQARTERGVGSHRIERKNLDDGASRRAKMPTLY